MENKVLQENLQAIGRYNSELVNKILTTEIKKSNFALAKTENDEYNLLFCNIPLHNEISPKQESEAIAKNIENKEDKNIIRIVYGLGLGYLADEVSNVITNSNIIIYEPNIDILKYVLEIAKIDAILKNNVFVATNKSELINIMRKIANPESQVSISFLNSYRLLFEKDIRNTLEVAQKAVGEHCAARNMERKNLLALYYSFLNLKQMAKNPDITQLSGIYNNKTALIASAGSTLSENIDTIRENQNKTVIFALNQTAKYLIQNGVKPDFIVNIDAYDNRNHFSGVNFEDYYFIFEAFCCDKIFNMPTKKTFNYISEGNFFNWWFRDCFSIKHNLKSAGTVSISAFLSACVMGFNKIILIGQDLAYKNGKCYTQGSVAENLECVLENEKYIVKAKNLDDFINSIIREGEPYENCKRRAEGYINELNKNLYTVKGQNGELLPTQTSYSYFVDYFTEFAKIIKSEKPNMEFINSSIGGAQIDGFKNMDLKSALEDAEDIEKLNLDNIEPNYDKTHTASKMQDLCDEFRKVGAEVWELYQNSVQILNNLEKENKITSEIENLIKRHKELCRMVLDYNNDEIVKFVLEKRIESYKGYLTSDFYSDIEKLKQVLKLMTAGQPREKTFCFYADTLADCKSFITE